MRWTVFLVGASVAALVSVLIPITLLLQPWFAVGFILVCPGMAFVRLLRLQDKTLEWTLAITLSLALAVGVTTILVFNDRWSTKAGVGVLSGLTLVGVFLASTRLRHVLHKNDQKYE